MKKRRSDAKDAEIGQRIRAMRLERGISQTELGAALGVSFQQLQKYEKGTNRVGAGRLYRIAETLKVPVTFFFGGTENKREADSDNPDSALGFLNTAGAVRLVRAYAQIRDPQARRALVDLVEKIGT